ncbi:MAG TPA: FMN-binding negative transcriptional regulator [Solirubrobacterales bacterium]|jgi:transcriptional regulator|nr:FMN-binding negative transcriptional regulator [Solirubrobacterales bacterium]
MRPNRLFASDDPELVRELVREHPWGTLVTATGAGLRASHYPLLLDEEADGLTLLTHLGRPDEEVLEIDRGEVLVIVQGHHGYISPSWYSPQERKVPTWNFTVAHLHGTPQILDEDENLQVLTRLVAHFERPLDDPATLEPEYAAPIAKGTVGLRIPIDRFELKRKLSQNRDEETRRSVIAALREKGPYRHVLLAEEMERELEAN